MEQGSQTVAPAPPAPPAGNERVVPRCFRCRRCLRWSRWNRRARWAAPIALASLIALAAGACRADRRPDRQPVRPGAEAEWAWLLAAKHSLDAERAQLAALGGDSAAPAPPPAAAAEALSPRDRLAREADALAQQFERRLVAYINANPPVEGAPLAARQLAAIRMKSDEEIAAAHEFIARGGDYRRACEIYEAALAGDPQNPRLREELARAQAARYISAGRFARAAPGMTAEQVRAALGPPNVHDVHGFADQGVVGWFYPRDASGTAAAVWFEKRAGKLTVYRCDWDALPAPSPPPASPAPAAGATGATGRTSDLGTPRRKGAEGAGPPRTDPLPP
jgi:hypothetical protein